MKNKILDLLLMLALLAGATTSLFAQGTAFTYQGRLNFSGSPANGLYDFTFSLSNAPSGGAQVGGTATNLAVGVTNGLFITQLNFGAVFSGNPAWLAIGVRTNGAGSFTGLAPLQALTPVPYAIFAGAASNISGTVSSAQIGGTILNSSLPPSPNFSGTLTANQISGNGAGVTNVNAALLNGKAATDFWQTGGNAGTSPTNGNFLGTTDNQPLELRANNSRALRIEPNTNGAPNVIGGSPVNFVSPGVYGATISGGGRSTNALSVSFDYTNSVTGDFGTVGGGIGNSSDFYSFVGGGGYNTAGGDYAVVGGGWDSEAAGDNSTVAGGIYNLAYGTGSFVGGGGYDGYSSAGNSADGNASVIDGGMDNFADGWYSTIGGGYANLISFSANEYQFIGGGCSNSAAGAYSVIGGGQNNSAANNYDAVSGGQNNSATGGNSFVGGGYSNSAGAIGSTVGGGENNYASGNFATVPGGLNNYAVGASSFAAGEYANANNNGTFVWSDVESSVFSSTAPDQFLVRAAGGVGIGTNSPNASLEVASTYNPQLRLDNQANDYARIRLAGYTNATWDIAGLKTLNFFCSSFGNVLILTNNGNAILAGTLSQGSDRNIKQDFAGIKPQEILAKVVALPVSEWSYKTDSQTRHIGPMSQDFYGAFAVGPDDKHITTVDEGGVALAAIQGLNQKLEAQNTDLKQQLNELKALIQQLTRQRK